MKTSVTKYQLMLLGTLVFVSLFYTDSFAQNQVLAWGNNSAGQIGNGSFISSNIPVPAATNNNLPFIALAAGHQHTVAIKNDGSLWAWGFNDSYQLGNGNMNNSNIPLSIYNGQWLAVTAGAQHSIGIQTNGSLWAWGRNTSYQLGDGTFVPFRDIPVRTDLGTGNAWTAISAGAYHNIALRADGSIWSWGLNNDWQLGDGNIYSGRNYPLMIQSGSPLKFTQLAAGYRHNIVLAEDGSIWGWGANNSGQLGDGTLLRKGIPTLIDAGTGNPWIQVAAGENFSAGIRADGSLWTWGGTIPGIAHANYMLPSMAFNGNCIKWKKITAGKDFIIAIKEDGSVWTCGHNEEGQLGNGTFTNSTGPQQINTLNYFSLNTIISAGYEYSIIAGEKLNAPLVSSQPKDTSFNACILKGNTYTNAGNTVSTAGIHIFSLLTQQGCDSIIRVTLTVIDTARENKSTSACDSFFFKQKMYYNNASLKDTLYSISGCDSIYLNIDLVVHQNKTTILQQCLPKGSNYIFNGNNLTQSGVYNAVYKGINNCDSTVQLQLVIAKDTSISITGMGTVNWNNVAYTQSTTIADTLNSINGCDSLYRSISIKVDALTGFFIPNSFTPNNDGLNDVFRAASGSLRTLHSFIIYNRYGQLIFETNQLSSGWNGTWKGDEQPMGNYIWIIKGIDNFGKNVEAKGTVLLLR